MNRTKDNYKYTLTPMQKGEWRSGIGFYEPHGKDSGPLFSNVHPRPKRNCIRSLVSYISVLLIRPKFSDEAFEKVLLKSNHKIYEPTNKPPLFKRLINWVKRN